MILGAVIALMLTAQPAQVRVASRSGGSRSAKQVKARTQPADQRPRLTSPPVFLRVPTQAPAPAPEHQVKAKPKAPVNAPAASKVTSPVRRYRHPGAPAPVLVPSVVRYSAANGAPGRPALRRAQKVPPDCEEAVFDICPQPSRPQVHVRRLAPAGRVPVAELAEPYRPRAQENEHGDYLPDLDLEPGTATPRPKRNPWAGLGGRPPSDADVYRVYQSLGAMAAAPGGGQELDAELLDAELWGLGPFLQDETVLLRGLVKERP